LKAKERLQDLEENDPSLQVRAAANFALRRFAMVDEKKKD